MKNLVLLLRPQQWLKNLFVFLPLFFDRHLLDMEYVWSGTIAFLAFCLAASSIYCFNDIHDVEADRLHPSKRMRPIASGKVSIKAGYSLMAFTLGLAVIMILALPFGARWQTLGILSTYYVLNIAYCVRLKQIALVDVFIIATGFVLRILMGGAATRIPLSHWIVLTTFLLALFLAFAKRRDDVLIYEETGTQARRNITRYNLDFMNQVITIVGTITMVAYIMYTVSEEVMQRLGSQYIYLTSIFVLAGIIRYLQLTIVDKKSGSPTKALMKDRFIQLCIIGWLLVFLALIYL